ncbi:terminase [Deinococcus sp. S9]|uniref:terminase n=1 Tax=Deinococcus sp. S9 TaxID=2545754 RepID=UPI001054184F|nr:terminase [Deinococcus sp. S9]TDE85306.1 terminase [Deinococcus sp. S9]
MTELTAKKREAFILALAVTGNVSAACKKAKVSRQTVYLYKREDPAFAAAWDEAEAIYVELLEAEADRRAVEGTVKTIYYQGIPVGQERQYSDTLLMFRLKALRPDKYRENSTVKHDGEMQITVTRRVIPGGAQ